MSPLWRITYHTHRLEDDHPQSHGKFGFAGYGPILWHGRKLRVPKNRGQKGRCYFKTVLVVAYNMLWKMNIDYHHPL